MPPLAKSMCSLQCICCDSRFFGDWIPAFNLLGGVSDGRLPEGLSVSSMGGSFIIDVIFHDPIFACRLHWFPFNPHHGAIPHALVGKLVVIIHLSYSRFPCCIPLTTTMLLQVRHPLLCSSAPPQANCPMTLLHHCHHCLEVLGPIGFRASPMGCPPPLLQWEEHPHLKHTIDNSSMHCIW